ncbi:hypothetical protein [Nonlabens ulvanivorans]|uniref:hypothetical protein n=1 Tax=Nonlabens ulvanivorans TaxID=906888 RepID=UPI003263BDC4
MITVVISIDPTTAFLFEIIKNIKAKNIEVNLIEIHPSDQSYNDCLDKINELACGSVILFLGHGQSDRLYGGESDKFDKKPIIKLNEMNIFKDKYLILLACDSSELLKSSFRQAKMIKSIGFGALPTEIEELDNNKKFANVGITQKTIDLFRDIIVSTVSEAIIHSLKRNLDFIQTKDYLTFLLNNKINDVILVDNNENLGDLIYQMKYELVQY